MAQCTVAYLAQHKGRACRGVECEAGPVRCVMCELVTRAHLAGVPTSRTIWTHVAAALDLQQDPPPQEVVSQLVNETVDHPLAAWAPRDPAHDRKVLAWLAKQWKARDWPVPPEFCPEVIPCPPGAPELFYKTYLGLGGGEGVTLLESGGGIAHNTTGLTSWCGSAVMAEWAVNYPGAVAGRRVLELGAGVGLTASVLLASPTPPAAYIATDCHHHVLALLHHNLAINLASPRPKREELEKFQRWMSDEVKRGEVEVGEVRAWSPPPSPPPPTEVTPADENCRPPHPASPSSAAAAAPVAVVRRGGAGQGEVGVMQVDWRAPPLLPPVDVVLAADVVYDLPLIPPLLTLIRSVLDGSALEQCSVEGDTLSQEVTNETETKGNRKAHTRKKSDKVGDTEHDLRREHKNAVFNGDHKTVGERTENKLKTTNTKRDNSAGDGRRVTGGEGRNEEKRDNTRGNRKQREAYLACTRRCQETLLVFQEEASRLGLSADLVYQASLDSDRALFVYNETHLPVKVYRLTLLGCEG